MPRDEFEAMIAEGREDIYRSVERAAASKIARREKHQTIAAKAKAGLVLGNPGPFSRIYADPPWNSNLRLPPSFLAVPPPVDALTPLPPDGAPLRPFEDAPSTPCGP